MFKGALPDLDAALASPPLLTDVLSVAVGSSAALAITREHGVQYVSGVAPPYDASSMRPPKIKAVAVSRPSGHACAMDDGAHVFCWGAHRDMQLGDSDETGAVRGVENAIEVVTGAQHTCALEAGGRVLCWADGAHGQLGDGRPARAGARLRFLFDSKRAETAHLDGVRSVRRAGVDAGAALARTAHERRTTPGEHASPSEPRTEVGRRRPCRGSPSS